VKTPPRPVDALPRAAVLRLLGVLALVLGPHLPRLPAWAALLVVAMLGWRAISAWRGWPLLASGSRVLLTLGSFAGIYLSFGRVSGQTAGVALVTVMAALKLSELRGRRDLVVMSFLLYFILVTHFLFGQELWTAAYLLVAATFVTWLLIDASHPGHALPPRIGLRLASRTVLRALPLMVLIFVLFPRIPGPIWGLPADAGAARSGLSDSMSPGEISNLIRSDAIAFRVRFDGAVPPPRQRYWRGPAFLRFDGRKWDGGLRMLDTTAPSVELAGPGYRYELTLEPTRTPWLFALDLPARIGLPADALINADHQLVLARGEVRERRLYGLTSHPEYRLQADLPDSLRRAATALPRSRNPRAQALARGWRAQGRDDAAIVEAALAMFRSQEFHYTLSPPKLGRDPVDGFLFETRRGFCEHYASSFAVLMRAAGIPARIVTGYQGGEKNAIGDYWIVRQSDAHAWTEVWLAGRGWLRVDPTAAVAPERVEQGIGNALTASELPAFLNPALRDGFRFDLRARWDWLNARWNHWVLGYGPELQADFLRRFGLHDWRDMILTLTVGLTGLLTAFGLVVLRRAAVVIDEDGARRQWRRLQLRLAKAGLPQAAHEGPIDYAQRVASLRPALAVPIREAARIYVELRYLADAASAAELRRLRAAIARVRPRR
jgi:transglutaminase-like putative cysteine protease